MRRFLGSAALVAASTLIALAAGEVMVRWLYKDQTAMFPRYHTDYRYERYTLRGIRPNAEFRHSASTAPGASSPTAAACAIRANSPTPSPRARCAC